MSNNNSKVRKVLFNEVSLIASIIAVILGGFIYLTSPTYDIEKELALIKQEIQTINNNHLMSAEKERSELKGIIEENREDIVDIKLSLERILTILEK